MGGPLRAKRAREERRPKKVIERPSKKQKRAALAAYHSSSEDEADETGDFDAVNLLDSDDDIHNAQVDDGAAESEDAASSSDEDAPAVKPLAKLAKKTQPKKTQKATKKAEPESDDEQPEDEEEEDDDDEDELELDDDEYLSDSDGEEHKSSKSKRNDPNAFATSLNKILSTKLSTSKRADPVLSRSAAAHEASRAAVDSALEAKAKKQMRDEKRRAKEKGRVKDVLIATTNEYTGEVEESTAEIMETERRLRKVAQRGVVRLFNAVRAAQVQAAEASKEARSAGTIGMGQKEEKVTQMSKKGFLDLIASGGGGLKKGGLEEA